MSFYPGLISDEVDDCCASKEGQVTSTDGCGEPSTSDVVHKANFVDNMMTSTSSSSVMKRPLSDEDTGSLLVNNNGNMMNMEVNGDSSPHESCSSSAIQVNNY